MIEIITPVVSLHLWLFHNWPWDFSLSKNDLCY